MSSTLLSTIISDWEDSDKRHQTSAEAYAGTVWDATYLSNLVSAVIIIDDEAAIALSQGMRDPLSASNVALLDAAMKDLTELRTKIHDRLDELYNRVGDEGIDDEAGKVSSIPASYEAYFKERSDNRLPVIGIPTFCIDITRADRALLHQRSFDVRREGFILNTTTMTVREVEAFRNVAGRDIYEGCGLPATLTMRAEVKSELIKKIEPTEKSSWVPAIIATITGRLQSGRKESNPQVAEFSTLKGTVPITYYQMSSFSMSQHRSDSAYAYLKPSPHGDSYQPTLQSGGHFPSERGKPPGKNGELTSERWAKAYNAADSRFREGFRKPLRADGRTRGEAIKKLIEDGILEDGYVDNDI